MSDAWEDRLSEYVDGTLDEDSRRGLEAHLEDCTSCASIVADLRTIVSDARALTSGDPDEDLWPGIERRIHGGGPARVEDRARVRSIRVRPTLASWGGRLSLSIPQFAAACLLAAIISGGAVWLIRPWDRTRQPAEDGLGGAGTPAQIADTNGGSSRHDAGIAELRRVLAESGRELDPATVRALEENLMIIELAIRQADRALAADPANAYLQSHRKESLRRREDLLRKATVFASMESAPW